MILIERARAMHAAGFETMSRWLGGDVLPLLARLALAGVFWRSLLTKVSTVNLLTYTEFINDFPVERARLRLPDLPLELRSATLHQFRGDFALPLLPAELVAWMATLAEFVLPILLVIGLMTRLSALALIVMTLVIQVFIYPDAWWSTHALWVVIAGYVVVQGPGRASADHVAGGFFAR